MMIRPYELPAFVCPLGVPASRHAPRLTAKPKHITEISLEKALTIWYNIYLIW